MVEDRAAGMAAGPGGGHEHIHCSLTLLDELLLPKQILRQQHGERRASKGAVEGRGGGRESRSNQETRGAELELEERLLAVVAAKYFFNGDASIVFRYRLYSFHPCPVSSSQDERGIGEGGEEVQGWGGSDATVYIDNKI